LRQRHVLNTLTGRIDRVEIRPLARDAGPSPDADAYRYDGDLRLVSWYSDDGCWLGMRFEGQDGSTIEYRCRNCDREDDLMTALRADFTSERDGPAQWRRTDR